MLNSFEKTILLSGSIFGSIFLFTNALYSINNITLHRYNTDKGDVNKLIMINGITMLFSGFTFVYFTYNAIK